MVMREAQDLDNAARSASKSRSTERPSVPLRGQPSAGIEGAPRVLVKKALPRSFMRASIDTQIASRRSFTSAAFVQDDSKRGFPSVILSVSEGSTRSDRSFSPHLSIRSFTEGADSRRASGEQYDGRSEKGTTCIAPLASALTSIIHAEEKKLFTPIPAAGRGRGLGRAHWLAALACAVAIAGCAANAPAAPTVRPLMVQVPVLHETACPAPALANPVLPIAALKPGSPPADTMRAYAAAVAILKGAVRERDAVLAGCVQTGDATREQAENIR
jgi:hypothetical protein